MDKEQVITDKDLALRAIECYLTRTPRDRRREVATGIYRALEKLGYLPPGQVEARVQEEREKLKTELMKLALYHGGSPCQYYCFVISEWENFWQALREGQGIHTQEERR